ncbi:MAG: Flp pilus assembly protein CpaB [Candidatus Omnitrophica bacterium]|nr:Flp pilus assembly protein CpaB [Candidatus Omnitrophota bacterium]MBU4467517.1 Flp pilus assembly protein CpaB [Candidatus Omnitrophota bacterium]MCG2713320.1 Flp pilus assembly protein CpaB [Candidatus Omnitrophota bacterium]
MKIELRRKFPLIIAVVCGIAAIILLNLYLGKREVEIWERMKQEEQKALAAKPKVTMGVVMVAKKDIPAQTPITAEDITFKQVPVEYIQPGAVTSFEQVMGQIASGPIAAEEQILSSKLLPPGNIGKTLSEITPEGKRAITVSAESLSGIASLLKPGDYVDIFALIALPKKAAPQATESSAPRLISLFQGIQVLAMGNEMVASKYKTKEGSAAAQPVTFALTPQEAVLLSFVQEHGKIKLALRSSQDTGVDPVAPVDWDTLLNYLSTSQGEKIGLEGQPVVEIYRGLQKEIVPLSAANKEK